MGSGKPAAETAAAEGAQARAQDDKLVDALAALDTRRRDALLEAVAISARELLNSPDLHAILPTVAEQIGAATDVDRVHIFLVNGDDPKAAILRHCVWIVPGLPTPPEFSTPTRSMADVGLQSWIPRLAGGETITAHTRDLDPSARALLETGRVKSVLAVPVFADGKWHGIIGFDDCRNERDWTPAQIETIKILAELVGGAIARAFHLKTLADAKRIVESSPIILYRLSPDPHFDLTYVSENVRRYGYSPEELMAEPSRWLTLVWAEDIRPLMAKLDLLIAGKTDHVQLDFRLKKADGASVWFDSEGYALRDATGKLTGIEGILSDVTERKNAERKLSFSHILLTTAIESSPDAILIVDETGRIITFNRHFIELWDIPNGLVEAAVDEPVLMTVASRVKDKGQFLSRVRYLYDHPDEQSHEELETADGRIIDRHSASSTTRNAVTSAASGSSATSPSRSAPRNASPRWRAPMQSPVSPTARPSSSGWALNSPARGAAARASPCSISISIISRTSTIRSAIRPVTSCCARWPKG